jgi:signal transduction histidine kinase
VIERIPFGTRLTIIYVSALAAAIFAFAAITYVFVNETVERTLDARLATALHAVRTIVEVENGHLHFESSDQRQLGELLGGTLGGVVLDARGAIISGNGATPPAAILSRVQTTDPARGIVVRPLRLPGDDLNLAIAPVFDGTKLVGRIAIWQSRASYREVMRITLLALIGIGAVVIVLATLVGIAITKRAMRPLTDLAAMISEIETHDLAERVAWQGPQDELGQLCATFDRLLDRLQDAFERRRRFAADASHELRTPISVIRAEAELVLRKPREPEQYREAIETIRSEIERLETLTDALLAAARADGSVARNAPVDLRALIERVTLRMTPPAQERGLELAIAADTPLTVSADAASLEGALAALVDNALRYATHTITIQAAQNGTGILLAVCDDGPGFSSGALRFGTDRFWSEALQDHQGTGLGLAIARAVAESCGGTLTLEASSTGGAQVTMHFPATQPSAQTVES